MQENSQTLKYRPRGDRVLVRRLERPERPQTEEAYAELPDSQQRPVFEGIVVAVGPGARNRVTGLIDPIDLKPGDHVCFVEHAGYEVEVDGETLLQMRDEEIHGQRL